MKSYVIRMGAVAALVLASIVALSPFDASAALAATVAGPGTYENDSASLQYTGTWTTTTSSNDSGGSYASSGSPTAIVSLSFTGTSIQWISRKTASSGINDVYIDNTKVASVDRYSSAGLYQQVVYSTTTLSDTNHTITIKATGTQNAAATGSLTTIDAFRVPDSTVVTGVKATADTDSVALTWTAVSSATGYRIYRGTSSSSLTSIADITASTAKYTDTK
ncbi:hypothetical protein [Subtercola sp. YIM 133946]|uniref:hypothetical protein n=1 Tax=Subtercola sp. YIM 133946 TaxID=3118909 RepID=UPI002F949B69